MKTVSSTDTPIIANLPSFGFPTTTEKNLTRATLLNVINWKIAAIQANTSTTRVDQLLMKPQVCLRDHQKVLKPCRYNSR